MAGKSSNIRSFTVPIYGFGQSQAFSSISRHMLHISSLTWRLIGRAHKQMTANFEITSSMCVTTRFEGSQGPAGDHKL